MEPVWKRNARWFVSRVAVPVVVFVVPPVLGLSALARHLHRAHPPRPELSPPAVTAAPPREGSSLDSEPPPREDPAPASCDDDDANRGEPGSSPRWPNTGDPLPARPVVDRCCDDGHAGATRWLGLEPHVPMAIVDDRGIDDAGSACCAPWARPHSRWRAVDAYGQQVGIAEITAGEGYDATACYELALAPVEGQAGVGLYASESGSWRAPRSAQWNPTPAERAAFDRFLSDADRVLVDHGITRYPTDQDALGQRAIFFSVPSEEGVTPATPTRFAVGGGAALVIAHVGSDGRWVADYTDNTFTNEISAPRVGYRPVAVFDMDGDGVPEVVVHQNGGDGWSDLVIARDGSGWSVVATSVGGSTA